MKFSKKILTLKTGEQVILRMAEKADAQDLIDLKKDYIKNTSTLPWTLEEYPSDIENERALIQDYQKSANSILLVAEYENQLIGNIDITGSSRIKMFHTGMVGMGIKEKWRNKGLGKVLIKASIKWAKKHSPLEILWLDVYASNDLGYYLYKSTGFKVSGKVKGFFKEGDGYIDKIQMFKQIK